MKDVKYAIPVLLAAHGIAHLPGFLVPWRFLQSPDLPCKTTLLFGRIDVGDVGIRIVGVAWLVIAVLMLTVAAGMALQVREAQAVVLIPVVASLALCVLELPHARIGLALNIVVLLFLTAHPTMGAGAMRWNHGTSDAVGRLASSTREPVGQFSSVSVVSLPAPVTRYFNHVLKDGQALVASAAFSQTGQFRMSEAPDSWRPFTATQRFSVVEPGFVWDARIQAVPMMPVFVRDSYVQGHAGMYGSILGLYTVVNATASPGLNEGALQRYLGEAVWFPTALLPQSGVQWEPINERRAMATLVDHGTRASLEFTFTADGDVQQVFAAGRLREVAGAFVATPWVVECADYADHNGMRIPTYCEVSWILPEGKFTYWKGRIAAGPEGPAS